MSFRAIQPFPGPPQPPQQPNDQDGDKPRAKNRPIRVACEACRKAKARCDGSRPRCLVCLAKNKECVFRGEEGQSREEILKSRIESREEVLKSRIESLEQRILELQVGQTTHTQAGESSAAGPVIGQAHDSIKLTMPSIPLTKRAVDGFFSCSGKLFHVFSKDQVSSIADSVYSDTDNKNELRKADIGSLMAVAAVGSQYTATAIDDEVQETFYHVARYYFDAVITQRPLDAIKVCTLLCMYNVFGKATVSLAYADVGLGMCDRYGLHCQQRQLEGIPDSTWLDSRKAWRTLVFLSTWLSATLGYKGGNFKAVQQISPSQLQLDDHSNISEVVQTEMTKIALLKARILHMHLAFKYLAAEPLNSMIQDLQDWYLRLPPQMQLQSLSEQDLPLEAKRSIYYVHLLYLGANMLLFRRIVAENIQISQRNMNASPLWHPINDLLSRQGPNALLAANSSARIVKLLLDEKGIFQRCWLVIFQSYTSCIIIMHAILTKLVSSTILSSYQDEMTNARLCLEALAFCGAADPVAGRFHQKAEAIYNSVSDLVEKYATAFENFRREPDDTENPSSTRTTAEQGPSGDTPQDVNMQDSDRDARVLPPAFHGTVKELSFDLLVLLCWPFKNPSYREDTRECLEVTHRLDPSRYEHPVLVERLAWDFEDSVPFQWNPEILGLGGAGSVMTREGVFQNHQTENRFLDSRHPSGWA